MGSEDQLFIGEVDRLSSSNNAIVREEEMQCLEPDREPHGMVNLGKLPESVVGQTVVFAYDGGTFGICLTKPFVSKEYLTKMQGKSGIGIENVQVPVGPTSQDIIEELEEREPQAIIEELEEKELITASPVLHSEIVYKEKEIENVVMVQSATDDEADQFLLAVMDGPRVPTGGTPVTVTGMQDDFVRVESCFTIHEDEHPSVDDEITVRVIEQLQTGTMGVTEVGIPVFIPTGQYQVGNKLKVTITERTDSNFVGEVVLDVDRESFGVEGLDGVEVENRRDTQRVIWNEVPIDVMPVEVPDLEPKGLEITGKNSEAIEAKWDLLSAVEDVVSIEVGDEITFEIRDANGDSCIGSYNGYPVVCSGVHAFPTECGGEQIRGVIESIESDKATVSLLRPPETKQELDIEVLGLYRRDGIAVSDRYLVKLPDASFVSVGDEISVVITSRGSEITKVSAGEHMDVKIGEEITFEITEAKGDSCIGSYQEFPVVCSEPGAFPDESESRQIKGKVQERKSDRLTVSLSHPSETRQELDIQVLGQYESGVIAIADGYLVTIPTAEVVSHGDVLRVGVMGRGDSITKVSVAARNMFQEDDDTLLIRLPETTGEYIIIDDELPVVTSHLPNIKNPVTLGVADVNMDSVFPTVGALPESHVPDPTDHVETTITRADEAFAIGVGEELPVELPLLVALETNAIEVKVGGVSRDRISGIAVGVGDRDAEHFHEYFICLQIAELAYRKQNYEKVREMLLNARDHLPSDELVIQAILTAHIPLIDVICETDITNIQPSRIQEEREQLTSLCEEIGETNVSDDIRAYLQACDLELKAAQRFIEAVNEATQDTRSSLQSIARGYDSKDIVMKGVSHVDRATTITSKTGLSTFVPSNELHLFVEELRCSYPIPVDELNQVPKSQQDENWLSYFVSGELTNTFEERLSDKDDDVETWRRPSVSTVFGVQSAEGAESMGEETAPGARVQTSESSPVSEGVEREVASSGDSVSDETGLNEKSTTASNSEIESKHSEAPDSDTSRTTEDVEAPATRDDEQHHMTTVTNDDPESDPNTDSEIREGMLAEPSSIGNTEAEKRGNEEAESKFIEEEGSVGVEIDDATGLTPTPVPNIEDAEELRELRREAEEDATENPAVESSGTVNIGYRTGYVRSPKIRRYARTRAEGTCEFCGDSAPFVKPDGEPYLEVHHVDELGDGGADDPSLVVALCPSCHMEIHYGRRGSAINMALREKLEAGLGDVGAIE